MTADRVLHLWLHGEHIGEVERLRSGRARLRFDGAAITAWGVGTRLLSYALPLTRSRVESVALDVYLANLLPEGAVRAQLESEHAVRPGDSLGLLARIGAECAGAVQLTPDDQRPTGRLVPLSSDQVNQIVADLPTITPPHGEQLTASLGGVQGKVLLARSDAGWAWPAAGAMSSHIIKPEPSDPNVPIPEIVEIEDWALRLARSAGVPAAEADVQDFGGRRALVVRRYDRRDGRRLHQEDFAQALGIRPGDKYESTAGHGRLAAIARGPGAEADSPRRFRDQLLRLLTFNVLIGNGDGHAKNYSLMIDGGVFSLAPAYDVAPVHHVNRRFGDAGMRVDGQRQLQHITAGHLLREAARWGVPESAARAAVAATLEAGVAALDDVPAVVAGVRLADAVRQAGERLLRGLAGRSQA